MNLGKNLTRGALVAGLGAALAVGAGTGSAFASSPTTNTFTVLYNNDSQYSGDTGGVPQGWSVSMVCWEDSSVWLDGTNRWFYISAYGIEVDGSWGGVSGFASANEISNQATVRHC